MSPLLSFLFLFTVYHAWQMAIKAKQIFYLFCVILCTLLFTSLPLVLSSNSHSPASYCCVYTQELSQLTKLFPPTTNKNRKVLISCISLWIFDFPATPLFWHFPALTFTKNLLKFNYLKKVCIFWKHVTILLALNHQIV